MTGNQGRSRPNRAAKLVLPSESPFLPQGWREQAGDRDLLQRGHEFSAVNGPPARWQVMANDKHVPLIGTCFFDLP